MKKILARFVSIDLLSGVFKTRSLKQMLLNSWYLSSSMRRVELKVFYLYSTLPRVLRCVWLTSGDDFQTYGRTSIVL